MKKRSPGRRPTTRTYTLDIIPAEEGGYVVTCAALPGLLSQGNTYREAVENGREALDAYLASLRKDGVSPPSGGRIRREQVKVVLEAV